MVRGLLILLATFGLAAALVGVAHASTGTPGNGHAEFHDNWTGITFVGGLASCPIFPTDAEVDLQGSAFYVFRSVNLIDNINDDWVARGDSLYTITGVASVHGVINASNGTYTVSGGGFHENRVDGFPYYFSGSGHATIRGPGGTVTGTAVFQDLLQFPPQEFDVDFASVRTCHLTSGS